MLYRTTCKFICALLIVTVAFAVTSVDFRLAHASQRFPVSLKSPEQIGRVARHLVVSDQGLFTFEVKDLKAAGLSQTEYRALKRYFADLNRHMSAYPLSERPLIKGTDGKTKWNENFQLKLASEGGFGLVEVAHAGCVFVPRWVLDAMGWFAILYGAGLVTVSLWVGGTIVGVPVSAILGTIGLWDGVAGTFFLWWVDRYYPTGVNVCW